MRIETVESEAHTLFASFAEGLLDEGDVRVLSTGLFRRYGMDAESVLRNEAWAAVHNGDRDAGYDFLRAVGDAAVGYGLRVRPIRLG